MKKTAKKAIALLLCLLVALSVSVTAMAKEKVTPVIVVSGMNAYPLTLTKTGEQIWPPNGDSILAAVKENLLPMAKFLVTKDWQYLADELLPDVYESVFEKVACDEYGESVYEIETKTFPESLDNYPEFFAENPDATAGEGGIAKSLIENIGGENVYYFNYDWRLSPMKHADDLKVFIDKVKQEKGVSEVTLIPCSMGGTVTNAYLYKYGNGGIKKIIYTMSAIQGLSSVGEMFNRNLDFQIDDIKSYMFSSQKDNLKMQVLMGFIDTLLDISPRLSKFADSLMDKSLEELNDRIYNELMIDSMGTFTGWWALIPDEYYDSAKEAFFAGNINPNFEKVIDSYHYNVNRNAEKIMKNAAENGTQIYLLASYGFVGAPYTNQAMTQTDCLIETHYQSGRATTAPYGKPFGEDYIAVGTKCDDKSHNHVSTDGIVDASTCFFPENTWLIKYNSHVGVPYGTDCEKLMLYLVTSDSYVTVHSNKDYPQFVEFDRLTGKLSSLTGDTIKTDIKDTEADFTVRLVIIADTIKRSLELIFRR